jgi:transcription elongation factor Elf1
MSEPYPFLSECPHCGHERTQLGYPRAELVQLLRSGAQLEADCSNCDAHWAVSVEERADLERALRL